MGATLTEHIRHLMIMMVLSHCLFVPSIAQQAPEPPPGSMAGQPVMPVLKQQEAGLLFHLSGKKGTTADYAAGGQMQPNFLHNVNQIPDKVHGQALEAADDQLLSYWAPGNIYAQRGTLSFFWRSRYPVGPTEFPIFRVGYADHSSWDMVWLRIDYNGSGFDAFVTDVGLTRTRISHYMDAFPRPDEWIHIALAWDETEGIRFYVNGKLAEKQTVTGGVYDSGLDQFGPHSRIISPYQVQSRYNFMRGGDLAELRIYDRMLSDENIASLSRGEIPSSLPDNRRDLNERRWRDAWWTRHGWNLPNNAPAMLTSTHTKVRKVEIHDAIDVKRWYWKANDGIRETTWPAAYNMSRLPGRYDYFVLPDWDCYSVSGQTIRFHIPDSEPWNHIEMWGKAWGQLTHESDHPYDHTFALRRQHQVKSYHRLDNAKEGGKIRFDNALIEEPIGSFMVYHVEEGRAPKGQRTESFQLVPAPANIEDASMIDASRFVAGRYPNDERAMMVGIPEGKRPPRNAARVPDHTQPLIHILIPYTSSDAGLDGVEIELPAMALKPTHKGAYPMNLRIKDPLWLMRDLADFSFSVEPGKPYTLWIDTRDRLLPEGRALYLTLAGAGADFKPEVLRGANVRLIYKAKDAALVEHSKDRFTQVRDLHAHNVEENPRSPRLNSYNRFHADVQDLLKHDPDHWLARAYWYWVSREQADRPPYEIPKAPQGVPEWAHLQVEYLRHIDRLVMYYINERQISNGEFGGGLSDDGDFTNLLPGTAFLGIEPDRILESLRLHMSAYYDQDRDPYDAALRQRSLPLFTNGLSTIQTDELHVYEEGNQVVAQMQVLDYGIPLHFNRGMEITKSLMENIAQICPNNHRRIRSRNYGGMLIADEDPWQWSMAHSYLVIHPSMLVARHNGNPLAKKMIIELADGLLATDKGEGVFTEINFRTGEVRGRPGASSAWPIFQAAYDYTRDNKYLKPISERIRTNPGFDPKALSGRYIREITEMGVREYINTHGSLWIDRVSTQHNRVAQEDRLGGVALTRIQDMYPQHHVSWKFNKPATYQSLAIYLPEPDPKKLSIVVYNLEKEAVKAEMTVWLAEPGKWRIRQGLDRNGDQVMDGAATEWVADLKRGEKIELTFPPREQSIVAMELVEPSPFGYWDRADLGIGKDDVRIDGNHVTVRVFNIGSVESSNTTLELRDARGNVVATREVPSIEAPLDLIPRWQEVKITVPEGTDLSRGSIVVDPGKKIPQITRQNTVLVW